MIVTELKALTREKEREKDRPGLQGVVKHTKRKESIELRVLHIE